MKKSNWHGGKGSGRRTNQDDKAYSDNWDAIFGKKDKQQDMAELNGDGNRDRGRYGEDESTENKIP
jgi:hypothetical protein